MAEPKITRDPRPKVAKGARSRPPSKGGHGAVSRDDPVDGDFNWRPSVNPPRACEGRNLQLDHGDRGGARIVNSRAGDVERRYKTDDPRFKAGVRYRSMLERAIGGSQSTLVRILEDAERQATVDTPGRNEMSDTRADALHDLACANRVVGRAAARVLITWLSGQATLEEIDQAEGRVKSRRCAAVLVDTALEELTHEWGFAHKAAGAA